MFDFYFFKISYILLWIPTQAKIGKGLARLNVVVELICWIAEITKLIMWNFKSTQIPDQLWNYDNTYLPTTYLERYLSKKGSQFCYILFSLTFQYHHPSSITYICIVNRALGPGPNCSNAIKPRCLLKTLCDSFHLFMHRGSN